MTIELCDGTGTPVPPADVRPGLLAVCPVCRIAVPISPRSHHVFAHPAPKHETPTAAER